MKTSSALQMIALLAASLLLLFHFLGPSEFHYDATSFQFSSGPNSYDLNNPKLRWDLPRSLEEISGLSYYKDNQLACVQDEDGILFIYSLSKKEIVRQEEFGAKGDYEGVEIVDDLVYVLKSNGNTYRFQLNKSSIGEVSKISTDLSSRNDCEGLGFEHRKSNLLLACKDEPGTKKFDLEKSRSIYSIDLPEQQFETIPRFIIRGKEFNQNLEERELSKKAHKPFKPSGVAVHPKSGDIFVIAHVGDLMIILEPNGNIKNMIPLNPKIFTQAEGICFNPEGDLFISSEGQGDSGYILKF